MSTQRHNNLRIDWNRWDIVEDTDSDEEMAGLSYEQENLINNFQDFTKTLPSEFMDKDLNEIFPGDINGEITDDFEDGCGCEESYECENNCCGEREEDINVENLDIKKLDAHLITKMEEGRITRKDRESLSSNDGELASNESCGCCENTDSTIPENE